MHSTKPPHLNSPIFLRFNRLNWVITVSVMLHRSHWLVWVYGWIDTQISLNCNQSNWVMKHSGILHHLWCRIFLLFNRLSLVSVVSMMLHPFRWLVWLYGRFDWIDLPQLQSVKLGGYAFYEAISFELSNLFTLQSIELGNYCFRDVSSFSLTGMNVWMGWLNRFPSTAISQTG